MNLRTLILILVTSGSAGATTLIKPIAAGSVTPHYTIQNTGYVNVGGGYDAVLTFASAVKIPAQGGVLLQINPYGPAGDLASIDVYGYQSSVSTVNTGDFGQGTLLGSFNNLTTLEYNQYDYLNITSFVDSLTSKYFGIVLAPAGSNDIGSPIDTFSSQASELKVLPEPGALALLGMGLSLVVVGRRLRWI